MQEGTHSDSAQLAQFGYRQELHRTLGSFSSFAAGYSYISILTGMFQTSGLGFFFAGPAFVWAWLFVMFGQFMVALQFAELSAHYPLAGSVYQWSKNLASKAWAWNTGWMYLCAQIITVPAVALAWQVILPQISTRFQIVGSPANSLNLYSKDFAENAIILALVMVTLTTIINATGVRLLARINNIGVIAELVGATGLIILFLIHANRGPGSVLTNTANTANVPVHHAWGYLGALLVGAIMPLYVMYGFDSAGSLAEETDNPRRKAPRAVLQALATAGTMGFLLILFGTMAVSDALYKTPTSLGLTVITTDVLGSTWGKIFLADVALADLRLLPGDPRHVGADPVRDGPRRQPAGRLAARTRVRRAQSAGVPGGAGGGDRHRHPGLQHLQPVRLRGHHRPGDHLHVPGLPGRDDPAAAAAAEGLARQPERPREPVQARPLGRHHERDRDRLRDRDVGRTWPGRGDYFYGTKWYQQYGPIIGVAAVVVAGLALYYGRQQHHGTVLAEHRADLTVAAEGD